MQHCSPVPILVLQTTATPIYRAYIDYGYMRQVNDVQLAGEYVKNVTKNYPSGG